MTNRTHSRARIAIVVGVIALALSGGGLWASAQIFGWGDYPGGRLSTVYEIEQSNHESGPTSYIIEIAPDGDRYEVTKTIIDRGQTADDLKAGFGLSGIMASIGVRVTPQADSIDLSPLSALDEREVEMAPDESYLLPDGARLTTAERAQIAGIDVVMGTYLHPDYPEQRVQIALTDQATNTLLYFPPLLVTEKRGADGSFETVYRLELIEFDHTP